MSRFQFAARTVRGWLPILLWTSGLSAQSCLVLSPASITADRTASMDLSLYSPRGTEPASVQWTFQYASSSISSLTVDDGPTLTATGKSAMCAGDAAAYNCLAVGLNAKTINDGIIAKIIAVLAPGATTPIIHMTNPRAASASGNLIPIVARILPVRGANDPSDCRVLVRPKGPVDGK